MEKVARNSSPRLQNAAGEGGRQCQPCLIAVEESHIAFFILRKETPSHITARSLRIDKDTILPQVHPPS
jgi:hypothetical protein